MGASRRVLATALVAVVCSAGAAVALEYDGPPEDYASYQPQTRCRDHPRPGTKELAGWIDDRFAGGPARASMRPCHDGGTSEHKDGRAIDWAMDATQAGHRAEVRRLLRRLLATDDTGEEHALARRMGVMYLIWDDHLYAAYDGFTPRDYRSSSCPRLRTCSATLRHRDHVHLSLSRPGARGATSWYAARP